MKLIFSAYIVRSSGEYVASSAVETVVIFSALDSTTQFLFHRLMMAVRLDQHVHYSNKAAPRRQMERSLARLETTSQSFVISLVMVKCGVVGQTWP